MRFSKSGHALIATTEPAAMPPYPSSASDPQEGDRDES